MSLTAADVAEIMRLVEQSSFDELTLEMDGVKLVLRRGAAGHVLAATDESDAAAAPARAGGNSGAHAGTSSSADARLQQGAVPATYGVGRQAPLTSAGGTAAARPEASTDPNILDVPAPLLGTFYRAPKPGAPPFVEVGTAVEPDTVIGIIEVMKLMNSVRAGVRGTVTEVLGQDGVLVEYGEPILRVRKAG